jgi:hypothetical protein
MRVVAVDALLLRAWMRYDHRKRVQMEIAAEQRSEKSEQEIVREYLRVAEGAGHGQNDLVAPFPNLHEPVRGRFGHSASHFGRIQRPELRDKLAMHGLNHGGGKRAAEENTPVPVHGDTSFAVVVGGKLPLAISLVETLTTQSGLTVLAGMPGSVFRCLRVPVASAMCITPLITRELLALRIIEMAKLREHDPHHLCEDALLYLAQSNKRSTGL